MAASVAAGARRALSVPLLPLGGAGGRRSSSGGGGAAGSRPWAKAHAVLRRGAALRRARRWQGGLENALVQATKTDPGPQGVPYRKEQEGPPVPVPSLHTVTFRVMDLPSTLRFYKDVFDLEVIHLHICKDHGFSLVYVGVRVALHCRPPRSLMIQDRGRELEPRPGPGNTADLWRSQARAEQKTAAEGPHYPQPGTMDAHDYLYHYHLTVLELVELHEESRDYNFKVSTGNDPPHLGFGGVGFQVTNLAEVCRRLRHLRVPILGEPTEDDPSVLVADPNGYAVRVSERLPSVLYAGRRPRSLPNATLAQCRLRVRDPVAACSFYERFFRMTVVCRRRIAELGLTRYYLLSLPQLRGDVLQMPILPDADSEEAWQMVQQLRACFLELQHHHGTEECSDFGYHSGNTPPVGFAHLGFMVGNPEALLEEMVKQGIFVIKTLGEGTFPQTALVMDPDGYWVELYPSAMPDTVIL
eukprot:TRINITY_DN50967_c0_g1_i1.p1 TRINITY_DN50967_c0_g1~~TRINITY_DN50967_c0_g1_i1.p1  ORF type:complete len:493 (+),score=153.21 TRINITY_DN50967_c0_g1_i1:68-1480(+)